jgi:hypothetical protein
MSPGRTEPEPVSWQATVYGEQQPTTYNGFPRNIEHINNIKWDDSLQPKNYEIFGTHPESRIVFLDVNILDSTGAEPYRGDVLIEGNVT